jgi:hypothetical protein
MAGSKVTQGVAFVFTEELPDYAAHRVLLAETIVQNRETLIQFHEITASISAASTMPLNKGRLNCDLHECIQLVKDYLWIVADDEVQPIFIYLKMKDITPYEDAIHPQG